jgi:hypothetical protein
MNSQTPTLSPSDLGLLFTLAVSLTVATVSADIVVNMAAMPLGGGDYQYDLSVGNIGPDDVALVSIVDAPTDDPLIPLTLEAPPVFWPHTIAGKIQAQRSRALGRVQPRFDGRVRVKQ